MRPRRPPVVDAVEIRRRVEANVRLIYHVANRLAPSLRRDANDLVAFGFLGLQRAAELFEADRGLRFSTYAVPRIQGAILDGVRRELPWSARTEKDRRTVQKARREAEAANEELSPEELAARLSWPLERVSWLWDLDVALPFDAVELAHEPTL